MLHHHLLIDGEQDVFLGGAEHDLSEMTRGSQVDVERTALGVHAGGEHDILKDELILKMVSIKDNLVVNDLSDQAQR